MWTTEWTTIVAALCLSSRKNEEKLSQSYFSNGIACRCCRCLPMLVRFRGSNNIRTTIIQSWCRVNTLNYLRIGLRCSLCITAFHLPSISFLLMPLTRVDVYTICTQIIECRASSFNRKSSRSSKQKIEQRIIILKLVISSREGCKRWNYYIYSYHILFIPSYLFYWQNVLCAECPTVFDWQNERKSIVR